MKLFDGLRRSRNNGSRKRPRRVAAPVGEPGAQVAGESLRGPRFALTLGGLCLLAWVVGYLVSTQILYPAAAPPSDLVEVPDLRGLAVAAGREELASAGLVMGVLDSLSHPTVAPDLILGQAPLPGQLALPGTEIRVTSSLGPQLRAVPDLVGVEATRARTVLETSGFVVMIDSVEADVLRGRVVETTPAPESRVALPAEIRLVVSRGPPLVTMPVLLGLPQAEALSVLDSLGLMSGEVTEVFRFGRDQGIVVEQEPPAETPLRRGSTVRISVGRRGG